MLMQTLMSTSVLSFAQVTHAVMVMTVASEMTVAVMVHATSVTMILVASAMSVAQATNARQDQKHVTELDAQKLMLTSMLTLRLLFAMVTHAVMELIAASAMTAVAVTHATYAQARHAVLAMSVVLETNV